MKAKSKGTAQGFDYVSDDDTSHAPSSSAANQLASLVPVGRGRGSTLPARMTDQGGGPLAQHKASKKAKKEKRTLGKTLEMFCGL